MLVPIEEMEFHEYYIYFFSVLTNNNLNKNKIK